MCTMRCPRSAIRETTSLHLGWVWSGTWRRARLASQARDAGAQARAPGCTVGRIGSQAGIAKPFFCISYDAPLPARSSDSIKRRRGYPGEARAQPYVRSRVAMTGGPSNAVAARVMGACARKVRPCSLQAVRPPRARCALARLRWRRYATHPRAECLGFRIGSAPASSHLRGWSKAPASC